MRPNEYQRAARGTAIYPASVTVFYPALGLAGEAGEFANKVKKTLRGDSKIEDKFDELRGELGDVCWYIAGVASDMGISLEIVHACAISAPQPTGDIYSLALKLCSRAGQVAELAEGWRNDGPSDLTIQFVEARLQEIVAIVMVLAIDLGTTFEKVCEANATKLAARKLNGTLKGDGDKR